MFSYIIPKLQGKHSWGFAPSVLRRSPHAVRGENGPGCKHPFRVFTRPDAYSLQRTFWCRCARGTHPFSSRTRRLRPGRPMVLCWRRHGRAGGRQIFGGIAQLGEHLPCKQGVRGSNPLTSTATRIKTAAQVNRTLKTEYRTKTLTSVNQVTDEDIRGQNEGAILCFGKRKRTKFF